MKPCGWLVRAPGIKPEYFDDYGRALARSIAVSGAVVELFERVK